VTNSTTFISITTHYTWVEPMPQRRDKVRRDQRLVRAMVSVSLEPALGALVPRAR